MYMKIQDEILTILFRIFKESESPWVTDAELRYLLSEQGKLASKEAIAETINRLKKEGYIEVKSIAIDSLDRGFIARLTIQGRNMRVHGVPSLTGI